MTPQEEIANCCSISQDNKYTIYGLKHLGVEFPGKFAAALIDVLWNKDIKN
jgi:hypothetical protein